MSVQRSFPRPVAPGQQGLELRRLPLLRLPLLRLPLLRLPLLRLPLLLLFWWLLSLPGAAAAQPVLELAIVAGNNRYVGDSSRDLRFADDDALAAAAFYREMHPGGRLWLLVEPDAETRRGTSGLAGLEPRPPTVDGWMRTLDEVARVVRQARASGPVTVHLFLHFSGHGERGGSLHFADQRLDARAFHSGLGRIGADGVFALMDGCHLAQVVRSGDGAAVLPPPSIFAEEDLEADRRPRWLGLIGATTAVPEHDYLAGGLLTLVGLSGLRGPADLDANGRITFREWGQYVSRQLRAVEGGPDVVVVPLRGEAQAVVVDLRKAHPSGIVLPRDFPEGQVRVTREAGGRMLAELYHRSGRETQVRLPPGRYRVLRLLPRQSWRHPGYPAQRWSIEVEKQVVALHRERPVERVALMPEGLRGDGELPPDVIPVAISAAEERSILNSPFRLSSAEGREGGPAWSLAVLGQPMGLGVDLSGNDGSRPSGAVRLAGIWHRNGRGSRSLGVGLALRYGVQYYPSLWVSHDLEAGPALRHTVQVGPVVQHLWRWSGVGVGLEAGVAWAPGLVTASGRLLTDPSSPAGADRFVFLRNVAADAAVAVRFPLSRSLELGPVFGAGVERFQLAAPVEGTPGAVVWEPQLFLGIELRQAPPRGR